MFVFSNNAMTGPDLESLSLRSATSLLDRLLLFIPMGPRTKASACWTSGAFRMCRFPTPCPAFWFHRSEMNTGSCMFNKQISEFSYRGFRESHQVNTALGLSLLLISYCQLKTFLHQRWETKPKLKASGKIANWQLFSWVLFWPQIQDHHSR